MKTAFLVLAAVVLMGFPALAQDSKTLGCDSLGFKILIRDRIVNSADFTCDKFYVYSKAGQRHIKVNQARLDSIKVIEARLQKLQEDVNGTQNAIRTEMSGFIAKQENVIKTKNVQIDSLQHIAQTSINTTKKAVTVAKVNRFWGVSASVIALVLAGVLIFR